MSDQSDYIQDFWQQWKTAANFIERETFEQLGQTISSNPDAYAPNVQSYDQELRLSRAHLEAIRRNLSLIATHPDHPTHVKRYGESLRRYQELSVEFYRDMRQNTNEVGFIPILYLSYASVGLIGATLAVALYHYAVNLREETALQRSELDARVRLAEQGKVLPPTTLPAASAEQVSAPALFKKVATLGTLVGLGYLFYVSQKEK